MLKYTDTQVVFREIPDEITLCINISGCPNHCEGCHSPELRLDIGEELTDTVLHELIERNLGITCICLMGGDQDPVEIINLLCGYISNAAYTNNICLKTAWYSGKEELPEVIGDYWKFLNYIKLGPYKRELGPLNSKTTNQRLYQITKGKMKDITYKFWENA